MLSDDTKRAQYDQFGAGPFYQQSPDAGQQSRTADGWHYQSTVDPEELFRKMFGEPFLFLSCYDLIVVIEVLHGFLIISLLEIEFGNDCRPFLILGGRNPFANFAGFGDDFAETAHGYDSSQQHVMNITFEEAARGVTKNVTLNVIEDCPTCKGKGVQPGYKKVY